MQRSSVRATVRDSHPDANVFRRGLGVLYEDIEVSTFIKDPSVFQFELWRMNATVSVFADQTFVRKCCLRILVESFGIRMSRRGIQIVVLFFDVFAVIAFVTINAKESLFQNRIATIPQGQSKAQATLTIRDTQQTIFAPAIRTASRLIVGKRCPWRAVRRLVFADRAPLPF